jgi:hypothetical protein
VCRLLYLLGAAPKLKAAETVDAERGGVVGVESGEPSRATGEGRVPDVKSLAVSIREIALRVRTEWRGHRSAPLD